MYRAPSENRKSCIKDKEVGDKGSRLFHIQDKLLAQIAKQTSAPIVLCFI